MSTQENPQQIRAPQIKSKLQKALDEIKTLRGIVPICSNCKKIRDDKGFWEQVEGYVAKHTEARFSHGVCPDCLNKLYPEYFNEPESGNSVLNVGYPGKNA
jgi:hypothetical protein